MKAPWLALALAAALAGGCGRPGAARPPTPAASARGAGSVAGPDDASGLGELMGLAQMRQSKLWFAGEAGNWKLAAYELDEMKEGFADIVRYHASHKKSPVPIDQAVETIMTEPLAELGKAIEAKDRKLFETAYDTVTEGCNSCHQATDHGFIVLQRPKSNPVHEPVVRARALRSPAQSFAQTAERRPLAIAAVPDGDGE